MAAPQIPNLATLRGGLRSRGRGRITGITSTRKTQDEIVQSTDSDAATSRLSAVEAGYLDDPFARLLFTNDVERRLPLMNRGTYGRTIGVDRVVDTFIASQTGRKQIISLGAGSDTRFFRLRRKYPDLDLTYHEIDFQVNTNTKIERLTSALGSKMLKDMCNLEVADFQVSDGNVRSPDYSIHAQDLRKLPENLPEVDVSLPTLLISECCLVYLSPEEAEKVLTYFNDRFMNTPLAVAIYEPVRPNDPFGKTMIRNLVARGIQLQTLEKYADLKDQILRLQQYGFTSRAEDIYSIWRDWVEASEKERVEALEWMDEVEEFVLLGRHYCLSWGWKNWPDDSEWRRLPASC